MQRPSTARISRRPNFTDEQPTLPAKSSRFGGRGVRQIQPNANQSSPARPPAQIGDGRAGDEPPGRIRPCATECRPTDISRRAGEQQQQQERSLSSRPMIGVRGAAEMSGPPPVLSAPIASRDRGSGARRAATCAADASFRRRPTARSSRQLPAQRREPVARLAHRKGGRKRQRHHVDLVRERGAADVFDRRLLRAKCIARLRARAAPRPSAGPTPCCSPGNVVSRTLGAPVCRGKALITVRSATCTCSV